MNQQPSNGLSPMYQALRGTGIRRPRQGRWLGGVAAGLAARANVDPVLVRVALVVLGLFFGLGLTVYLLAWCLLPDEDGSIALERAVRDRDGGSVALCLIAALSLLFPAGLNARSGWSVSLLAVGVILAIWYLSSTRAGLGTPHRVGMVETTQPPTGWSSPAASVPSGGAAAADPGTAASASVPAAGAVSGATWGPPAGATSGAPAGSAPFRTGPDPTGTPPSGPTPPGFGTPPPAPPNWQQPPRPRRRSGGFALVLLTLGLAIVTYQVVRLSIPAAGWPGSSYGYAWAAVLAVLGLIVLGLGLAGWRLGLVGLASAVLAVGTLLGMGNSTDGAVGFGSRAWTPTTATQVQDSYSVGFGEGRLDLTRLPAQQLNGRTVSLNVGLGDMTVVVPASTRLTVRPTVGMGDLRWTDDAGNRQTIAQGDSNEMIRVGTGPNSLDMDVNVGMGTLSIERK